MNIYLDIDGVLLTKNLSIPDHGQEFINFVVDNFDCYWLTTHCRGGQNKASQYLSQFYPPEIIRKIEKIKPEFWSELKTEVLDFDNEFIWLEDNPFDAEKKILKDAKKMESLIVIDLERKGELRHVEKMIKKYKFKKDDRS